MDDTETPFVFPIERLEISKALLFVLSIGGCRDCTGFGIYSKPIMMPDWNIGRDKETELYIELNFRQPFGGLEAMANTSITLETPVDKCPDDLGSVYALCNHNYAGWQSIRFGGSSSTSIQVEVDLFLDFDSMSGQGGVHRKVVRFEAAVDEHLIES